MIRLVLFHPIDPRGQKMGGIETHVRNIFAHHTPDLRVLLVGVDEIGDWPIGKVGALTIGERTIDFLPVLRIAPDAANAPARRLAQSLTLRFALAATRHLRSVRRAIGDLPCCCEVERNELSFLPRLLRKPFVLVVHNDPTRTMPMDSLLARYGAVRSLNEQIAYRLADGIVAVNEAIAADVARIAPAAGSRTDVEAVSVDTASFQPTAFPRSSTFRVCFAGRLDAFKDPRLMFAALARAADRIETSGGSFRSLAFDYVGASDPTAVAGWEAIQQFTIRHGACAARDVAQRMRDSHCGIITSFFEGMPCYLLEMLASGRPVAAIELPQFAAVIRPGVSGALVPRGPAHEANVEAMADALVALADAVATGKLEPERIAALAQPFAIDRQMERSFARYRALAAGRPRAKPSIRAA